MPRALFVCELRSLSKVDGELRSSKRKQLAENEDSHHVAPVCSAYSPSSPWALSPTYPTPTVRVVSPTQGRGTFGPKLGETGELGGRGRMIHASKISKDLRESWLEGDQLSGPSTLLSRRSEALVSLVGLSDKVLEVQLNVNFR